MSDPRITACHIPKPASAAEARIYRRFRDRLIAAHCADDRPAHRCCGEITITRDAITLGCRRCGDLRLTIVEGAAA